MTDAVNVAIEPKGLALREVVSALEADTETVG
jgi:hypothetical protein